MPLSTNTPPALVEAIEQVDGDTPQKSLDYWKSRLDGIAPVELPHDRPRPPRLDDRDGRVEFELSPATLTKLEAIAESAGVTLYMTLLAAFDVLLMRYSGQSDISVGTPIEGRTRLGLDDSIGYFVNMLVMRTDLSGDPRFDELLARVQATCLGAYGHQDVPFERVVQHIAPERALDHNPLLQVSFALHSTPHRAPATRAVPERLETTHTDIVRFDLSLTMTAYDGGMKADLEYSANLFEHATIERMAAHLRNLIDAIVENPYTRLSALPLMGSDELDQLLVQFNDTARPYPLHKTLHQLFEEQAARTPDTIAVVFEHLHLTYAELDARANRLAHHLRSLGVQPDVLVGLCMPRCTELVVAMLAVLKAGGAYLPIDPDYPPERIGFMLEDSAAPVVLSTSAVLAHLPQSQRNRALVLDGAHWLALADTLPNHRPEPTAGPQHLAYVIYTSGSTGRPKGVMVHHQGVCNHVFWLVERIGLAADDRVLQKISISFDASVPEFFAPLDIGARVVLTPPNGEKDTASLVETIRQHGVTVFQTVPSALRVLLQESSMASCESLRYVVSGGEALDWDLADDFQRCLPQARLGNMYGPTEASVVTTSVDVADVAPGPGPVPIGRPIANARVYVLDAHRQPVPIGVPGELYIGGTGLARGYLNRPELTAERFVDDPFVPGERLYRTGDLVRWRPDGLIGFIGRTDHQVKIRGFRIELGEIENALKACPGVRNGAVVVHEDRPGNRRLVAYVEGRQLDPAGLRTELSARLPDYMVPQHFVVLPELPLLPNGKLDRKALPAPDWTAGQSVQHEPPQGPIEQTLAEIWSEALGVPDIGRHDNFFELGGHSLLVVTMVQAALRRNLPIGVSAVFAHPTVATLAASIPPTSTEPAPVAAPAIPDNLIPSDCIAITPAMLPLVELSQPDIDRIVATVPEGAANIQDIYPLAPLQEGILYHHQLDTEGDTYLLRWIRAFDSRARLDAFLQALQVVTDRHDSLRTAVVWEGLPQPVQVVYRRASLPVQWLDCDAGEDALEVLAAHSDPTRLRLTLTLAPLMRAYAVQEHDGQACHLALVVHHIIGDHASGDLIHEEICTLLEGRGDTLDEPIQFRSFVAQVRETTPATHETYFRRLLGDLAEPTLPFGLADTRVDPTRIRESRESLSDALAERIRSAANSRGVSAAVLFHVAWAMVLARCSEQEDVVFGTVLLGRSQGLHGIDRVIGLCMNTLPVRLRLGSTSADAVVTDTYRQLGELIEHEQAPLALVQRCSAVPASSPLFSALLNYRHDLPTSTVRDEERTNYPVSVAVDDIGTGFHVTAQCVDGIDPRRVVDYLIVAVGALTDALDHDPQAPVRSLDLLPDPEREMLLRVWNDTEVDYPLHKTLHQLFEEQAARTPEATAVVFEHTRLDYASLEAQANRVAHHLRSLGVRPDVLVGVCMHRCPELVVAMLAVLKAGGAYVPIDPEYPPERIAFMLADSAAPVVLITEETLSCLPQKQDACTVVLDGPKWHVLADALPAHCPERLTRPGHLAYVIYTSGSTGRPKGVMIQHQGITNHMFWLVDRLGLSAADRVLQKTSISFDASVWELFAPLIVGARLVLARRGGEKDPKYLARVMRGEAITILQMVPAALRVLLQEPSIGACNTLRYVVSGGEALDWELVRAFERRLPCAQLDNFYGPTEATIDAASMNVADVAPGPGSVPIGRPVANTRLYVFDAHRQPVPLGVAGELYIGGAGLARGYLNRPELTAERFVDDPFTPGQRLYRTGDLVRWRPDGLISFIGRTDHQVKIRGFRIELGEIEAALGACAGVGQAVLDARADHTGTAVLVAYVVPQSGQSVSGTDLRQALRQTLPEYMVPQYFVQMEVLPLTPNGKIDRKALPAPEAGASGTAQAFVEPRTPTEVQVAAIFAEILQVERVGAHSDFFELGGHSLLAIRLMSRLGAAFKIALPLQALFEAPTVSGMSDRICGLTGAARAGEVAGEPRSSRRGRRLSVTERRLLPIWERVLGASRIDVDDSFLRLQGTQDLLEQMLGEVRREFGVFAEGFPLSEFLAEPTIETLARTIDGGVQPSSSLLVCLQPQGSRPPVFLVHAGGGYVFFYRALAARLGRQRPLYGIRAATRADRTDTPFDRSTSVESLAARYIEELRNVQPLGPYTLGGACFGGVIAFEMARQLLASGEQLAGPVLLFDAFVGASDDGDEYAGTGEQYAMNRVEAHLRRSSQLGPFGAAGYLGAKVLKNLPTAVAAVPPLLRKTGRRLKLSDASIEMMRWAGTALGVSALLEEAQRRTMERFLEATSRLMGRYRPGVLDGAIVLFKAADGPDPTPQWQGLARDGIVVHELPGVHLDMMEEPAVMETSALVARHLAGRDA